jgi:hypothetical protein
MSACRSTPVVVEYRLPFLNHYPALQLELGGGGRSCCDGWGDSPEVR